MENDPINDLRRGMEIKVAEMYSLLRDMHSVGSKQNDQGKKRLASSVNSLIGELHNLAERLTDQVMEYRGR